MPGTPQEAIRFARQQLFDRVVLIAATAGAAIGVLAWLAARGAGAHAWSPGIAVVIAMPGALFVARRVHASLAAEELRLHAEAEEAAALHARMGELAFLFDPSTQSMLRLDTQTMLDLAAQRLLSCFEAHQSSIMLHNPDRGLLEVRAVSGVDANLIAGSVATPGEGIAGTVFERGECILLTPEVMAERFPGEVKPGRTIRTSLSVPMRYRETTVGVVSVSRNQGSAFGPVHVQALEAFASHCAATVLGTKRRAGAPRLLRRAA